MRLGDRIRQADIGEDEDAIDFLLTPVSDEPTAIDPFVGLKQRAQERLYARLGGRITDPSMSESELRQLLIQELSNAIDEDAAPLSAAERHQLVEEISRDVLGYGPIQSFLDDRRITESWCSVDQSIYVERDGRSS